MKRANFRVRLVALMLLGVLSGSAGAKSQKDAPPQQSSDESARDTQSQTSTQSDQKPSDTSEQKQSEPSKPMTLVEARRAQLLVDTQKLYQLTQKLKAELATSNKDTLSIAVIKKAEEVEKLAKSLKERMRAAQ